MSQIHLSKAIIIALIAAILFGSSTPFAKQLVGHMSPLLLAGLLYLGSGIGLILIRILKNKGWGASELFCKDWWWLLAVTGLGGVAAPILLMLGLVYIDAATASFVMAIGVWLHLTETHDHTHTHEFLFHTHHHNHDEHHQHTHDFPWNNEKSHTHPHQHTPQMHSHPHYPDIHHRHAHKKDED